jgi:hypothetical protein
LAPKSQNLVSLLFEILSNGRVSVR